MISGKQFAYVKAVENTERVAGGLQGFGSTAADNDFRIEHRKAGTGIRIQGDRPLQNAAIWSIRTVVAVEPFIEVAADPGKVITWGETNVGTPGPFAAAGLEEVSSPTLRRRVMRLDL